MLIGFISYIQQFFFNLVCVCVCMGGGGGLGLEFLVDQPAEGE